MHPLLTHDSQLYSHLLVKTTALAVDFFDKRNELPPGRYVADLDPVTLPEAGMGGLAALDHFRKHYFPMLCNSAGPRYFGFVTGGSTPAAVAGDWLVSALDQNACGSNDSIAPQLERQTLGMLCELFGMDEHWFGSFVTGATQSNLVSLAIAREWIGRQVGKEISVDGIASIEPITILSGTPHASIYKSLSILGFGRKALRIVQTMKDREAVDIHALEEELNHSTGPVIVVANAGTVNTVDFDDIESIALLKNKYNFWLHVDAAFGGFAACSPNYCSLTRGINMADSVTIDAHKWLNVPYDAAMQFTRHKELQGAVFRNQAAYLTTELTDDFFHYTPESSRRFRALPAWFALMAYGKEGCREVVERNCETAALLGRYLESSDYFELLAPVRMNVVCFTLAGSPTMDDIRNFLQAVRDHGKAFFTPTQYSGKAGIRAAFSNWQTTASDVEMAFESLKNCARKLTDGTLENRVNMKLN